MCELASQELDWQGQTGQERNGRSQWLNEYLQRGAEDRLEGACNSGIAVSDYRGTGAQTI
jgi:hypothetical protein